MYLNVSVSTIETQDRAVSIQRSHRIARAVRPLGHGCDARAWLAFRQAWQAVPPWRGTGATLGGRIEFSIRVPRTDWRIEARALAGELKRAQLGDPQETGLLGNGFFAEFVGLCIEAIPAEWCGAPVRVSARLVRLRLSSLKEPTRLFDASASPCDAVCGIALIRRSGVVIGDIDVLSPSGSRVGSVPLNDPLDVIVVRSRALTIGPLYWIDPSPSSSGLADLLALTVSADPGVGSLTDSWET